jgi:ring-1,2-phenylacetyl-CoA epoxidase subunit PaaE
MIHFYPLPVASVRRETDDCVSITFSVPDELKSLFQFKGGQNLTIRTTINGQEVRRNYSICSSPHDGVLRIAVKKVAGGLFSAWANERLKLGDVLEVTPPTGRFYTELHPAQAKNYVAFAAGSGITPVLSLLKTTLQSEPQSTFTLVYGNRNRSSIIFKEELEALKDLFIHRFRIYHILSREMTDTPLNKGRIDREKTALLFDKLIDLRQSHEVFLCGPEELIFTVRDVLLDRGFDPKHIHFELFGVPNKGRKWELQNVEPAPGAPEATIQVKLDGAAFDFALAQGGQSILDAALAQGADLPYACKGGVCCTCKAKLLQGTVHMDAAWGLEPDEIAAGFILTCQSHPTSEKVVVDFDVK